MPATIHIVYAPLNNEGSFVQIKTVTDAVREGFLTPASQIINWLHSVACRTNCTHHWASGHKETPNCFVDGGPIWTCQKSSQDAPLTAALAGLWVFPIHSIIPFVWQEGLKSFESHISQHSTFEKCDTLHCSYVEWMSTMYRPIATILYV